MMSLLLGDFGMLWLIGWSHTDYFFIRCPVQVIYNRAAGHASRLQTAVSLAGPLSCPSMTFLFRGLLKEWRLRFGNHEAKKTWKPAVLLLLGDIIMIWFIATDGHLINRAPLSLKLTCFSPSITRGTSESSASQLLWPESHLFSLGPDNVKWRQAAHEPEP